MAGWTWKHREARRLKDGTYQRLPFDIEPWYGKGPGPKEHYAHISKGDPSKIAYTESKEKGEKDVQVRVKPGRYLQKFYGEILTDDEIREHATTIKKAVPDYEFGIATTPDDIENVYRNGPDSCMAYGISSYEADTHPARVYGAGDLGVAYIERKGRYTARALCWPSRKVYGRIYGDSYRLEEQFADMGWTTDVGDYNDGVGIFAGARLLKIEQHYCGRNYFVVPYVDWHRTLREEGDYLVLCSDREEGPVTTGNTNGLVEICRGTKCPHCGGWSETEFTLIEDINQEWCDSCSTLRTWTCGRCSSVNGGSRGLRDSEDGAVCHDCKNNYFNCDDCSSYYRLENGERSKLLNSDGEIEDIHKCKNCLIMNYSKSLCGYIYVQVDGAGPPVTNCGCTRCNIITLENEGQNRLPFDPGEDVLHDVPPDLLVRFTPHQDFSLGIMQGTV